MDSTATLLHTVAALSDGDLLLRLQSAVVSERRAINEVIALLIEVDGRRLYLAQGCSSLFTYCTQVLHLSEDAAYGRTQVARAARRFPVILDRFADGSVTLSTVGLLAPHLTPENHLSLLDAAHHKSKREVEALVAAMRPRSDAPAFVRRLEVPDESTSIAPLVLNIACDEEHETGQELRDAVPQPRPAHVAPVSPECYRIQVTVSSAAYEQLRRVRDLMRHTVPNGDLGLVFERAIAALHAQLMKTKVADVRRPRPARVSKPGTRHVPASVRREVWKRDDGQCAFVGAQGRCRETGFLEFHHRVPFAEGGTATADNLELRCRAHNAYESERWFGPADVPLVREAKTAWNPPPALDQAGSGGDHQAGVGT
jgi:5-methylcytosine-specific restriction endonuclease McrA